MYIYLTSTASLEYFPNNSVTSFRVKLPKPLNLKPLGRYSVALLDIDLPKFQQNYAAKHITLFSNMCQHSVSDNTLKPILHRLFFADLRSGRPQILQSPRYVGLNSENLDIIEIYLLDELNQPPSFRPGQLSCTLHIEESA